MAFLRSSLFIAIVSLFVLTGYSWQAFADCCAHEKHATQHAQSTPLKKAPADAGHCQCLCHQVFSLPASGPLRAWEAELLPQETLAHADEFPPDAVPVGIDHPPQLA